MMLFALQKYGFKWILTMDQDSSFSSNDINEYFKSFDNIEKKNI